MGPPRRVPWASKAELSELYDMIFSPGANDLSRQAALSRMSVYISSPSCPAFLHLLHGLVGALALPYPPTSAQEAATARMSYAMAVVRFVNGMVDPLQTGLHARPISHLAASLGLPPSLVALRHRATHEDLPPLTLLRRALEQSTEYLHRHSFLPLLASTSEIGWDRRARTEDLVARWKKVVKARVRARDVTKESESGKAVRGMLREFENEDEEDVLDAVVRVGLVPVGRKKRPGRKATGPTKESVLVWTPLLAHLDSLSPGIASKLAQQILTVVVDSAPRFHPPPADDEARKEVASYRWTLGTWLLHLWNDAELAVADEERGEITKRLARELVHSDDVVYALLASEDELADLDALLPDAESEDELAGLDIDGDEDMDDIDVDASIAKMEHNVRALEAKLAVTAPAVEAPSGEAVPGWTRAEGWTPCPIGVWA